MNQAFNILLVEDEKIMQQYLASFIEWESIGFCVSHICSNGKQAIDYLNNLGNQKKVDVILTDIRMPIMGGLELAQLVKNLYPEIKVILISAYSDFSYARKGIEVGVYNYLLKSDEEENMKEYFLRLHRYLEKERVLPQMEIAISQKKYSSVLGSCIEYIEKNYAGNIGLKEISESVHVHPQHICRIFSQELNKSFNDVLTEKRLDTSKVFLKNTNMKIYEIAEVVGYHKPAYYSDLFKKHFGQTPNEYRNNN